jgi:phage terminase small subunit
MRINARQKKFAEAKHAGMNNVDAAIAAGYSPKTAKVVGCKLAKHNAVMAAVLALKTAKADAPAGPAPKTAADFLVRVFQSEDYEMRYRLDAAKALLPYQAKKPDESKKGQRDEDAGKVAGGKFGARPAPLRAVS